MHQSNPGERERWMKRAYALALSTCALVAGIGSAQADWSVGAGFENLRWRENSSPAVKEDGLRLMLELGWTQSKDPGLSWGASFRPYVGNVDYTGFLLGGGSPPESAETHYRGYDFELQSWYRTGMVDYLLAAGW